MLSFSSKGQFYIVAAVTIVLYLYSLSLYTQQFSTIDVARYINLDEVVLADNVKKKLWDLNQTIKNCNEFRYYSKDFLETIKEFSKSRLISFNYDSIFNSPCNNTFIIYINSTQVNLNFRLDFNK